MFNDRGNDSSNVAWVCNGDHEDGEASHCKWRGHLHTGRRVQMDKEIDLIAIQLVEEMRMDLNDIPYADEYKRKEKP